jgi:simple sugar transport system ATP-binding protein
LDYLLEGRNLSKYYSGTEALHDFTIQVAPNEILGLVGDNGAGKSTTIKILSGAVAPDKGEIRFKGSVIDRYSVPKARALGIETVYQEKTLLPQHPLWRNVFLGRELKARSGLLDVERMKEETGKLIHQYLGLRSHVINPDSIIGNLSGGERQGVVIARALYFNAELVSLDEPIVGLSLVESEKVLNFIKEIKAQKKSCVFVTHNISHVYSVADRFVILDRGRKVLEIPKHDVELDQLTQMMLEIVKVGHAPA